MIDDAELLRRYLDSGSEEAFAVLVERHLSLVYFAALRRVGGDQAAAKDVAQYVFTTVAHQAASLRRHSTLTGWLYTTTRNAAAKVVRSGRIRLRHQQQLQLMHATSPEPEIEWERLRPVIDELLEALNARERDAVLLRFFEGRTYAEIGAVLSISDDAARMRVDRGLERIHSLLARRGITSSSAALALALGGQAVIAAPAGLIGTVVNAAVASVSVATGTASILASAGLFMSKNLLIGPAVAALAVGFGIYHYHSVRQSDSEFPAAVLERDETQASLRGAPSERLIPPATGRDQRAVKENVAGSTSSGVTSGSERQKRLDELKTKREQAVQAAVERQEARRASVDSERVDRDYRALFQRAAFTPAQIEQLKGLIDKNNRRRSELIRSAGLRDSNQEIDDQVAAEFTVDARALFGEAAAQQIDQFRETQPLRSMAEQLANNLLYTDASLTASQVDRLVEILARNARGADGLVRVRSLNISAALSEAESVLSPFQRAELQTIAVKKAAAIEAWAQR